MAKGKFEEWREPDGITRLSAWARDGLSEEQIAKNMGISRSTLSDWKKRYPDISDAIKKKKEVVDIHVENAMYKNATGHVVKIKKPFKCKTVKYDKTGKRVLEKETIEYAEEEVYVPPNVMAGMYWLNNRKPDDWKNKREDKKESGDNTNVGIMMLAPIDEEEEDEPVYMDTSAEAGGVSKKK